jgi:hypothetical protein
MIYNHGKHAKEFTEASQARRRAAVITKQWEMFQLDDAVSPSATEKDTSATDNNTSMQSPSTYAPPPPSLTSWWPICYQPVFELFSHARYLQTLPPELLLKWITSRRKRHQSYVCGNSPLLKSALARDTCCIYLFIYYNGIHIKP